MNPITNLAPSPIDLRDYPYVPPLDSVPAKVDLRPYVYEIEDQSTRGTCASNAIPSACELLKYRAGDPVDLSRLFLDYNTREASGRLDTEGVALRDCLNSARKQGLPPEVMWDYDLIGNWNVKPPQPVYDEALKTPLRRYEQVVGWGDGREYGERVARIKSALYEGLPVVIGLMVGRKIYGVSGPLASHNYPNPGSYENEPVGGHAMVIVGYDDSLGMFIVQNSWGEAWGDRGYLGLGYLHVNAGFFEAWAVRGFADAEIREPAGIKLEVVNRYRIAVRVVPEPDEVGSPTNIWIGAVVNGIVHLKKPDFDEWYPVFDANYQPTHKNYMPGASNYIDVVKWLDLRPYAGTDVYVGYGQDVLTWKLAKVCTVPAFS